jgi:diguanylate cyclase (GGDEF)-like protein/PAS domain S-box-containing protein
MIMNIEAVPYALPFIMVGIVSGGIVFSIWHRRFMPGATALMIVGLAHACWALGSAFNILMLALPTKMFWLYLQMGGVLLLPTAALAFIIEYSRRRRLSWWGWLLLLTEPLLLAGFSLTGVNHGWVNVVYRLENSGVAPLLIADAGPLNVFHVIYTYIALLFGALLLSRGLIRTPRYYRSQSMVLLVGLLIPWVGSTFDLTQFNPFRPLPITPVLFMFTQLAFLLGVFRYRLLDIAPMARSSLIERLSDAIFVLDEQDRIIDLNDSAKSISGCMSGSVIGKSIEEILVTDCSSLYTHLQEKGEIQKEISLNSSSFELRVFPLGDDESSSAGRLVVLHDITHRKELQLALLNSEEKYREVVERSNDGIVIVQDGLIRYSNPSIERMLAFPDQSLSGESMFDLFDPADRGEVQARYNKRLAGEETSTRYETILKTRQGENLNVEINAGLMIYEGRPAVLAFIRNITQQRRSAEELERSLALLRATIESTADGVLVTGSAGQPLVHNRRFEEMWNLPKNWISLPGHDDPLRLISFHVKEPQVFLERVKSLTDVLDRESTDLVPLNDGRILAHNVSPYRIGERAVGKVWNFRDVTRQKQAEDQLQSTNSRLSETVHELELHNNKMNLLSEMGDLLHSCATTREAYQVVADYARRLFPGQSGAVYMLNGSRNQLEAAVRWGDISVMGTDFTPDDCWAMRRGRSHMVNKDGLRCKHTTAAGEGVLPTLCLPMIAQGDTIGIFHLCGALETPYKAWEQVAQTVAESMALSLVNLRLRETLQTQSIRDPLTGLFNRRYMAQTLDFELRRAERYKREVGLLMIDIDHFKEFNDCYGHKAGDILLQAFANYLLSKCRVEDYACRYGGEEFLLIFPEAPFEVCRERAEELRRGMSSFQMSAAGFSGTVSISVGVASYPQHGQTVEAVLSAADAALYAAKRSGRDRVAVAGG